MIDNAYIHQLRLKLIDFADKEMEESSVSEIKDDLQSFYHVYNNIVANVGNCIVYRVRKLDTDDNHNTLKDVWCPEPKYVTSLGRANDVGEAVFYGALDPKTAITETKIESGDKFSLAFFKLSSPNNYSKSSIVIKESQATVNNPTVLDLFGLELSKFMVKEFTKDVLSSEKNKYLKTCAIAQILMELPNIDSIIYPSVKNHDSINIAMKEAVAQERLILDSVMTCELKKTENEQQVIIMEIKKLSDDGSTLETENHEFIPCPLDIEKNSMNFSNLFHSDNIPTLEEEFRQMMSQARENVT